MLVSEHKDISPISATECECTINQGFVCITKQQQHVFNKNWALQMPSPTQAVTNLPGTAMPHGDNLEMEYVGDPSVQQDAWEGANVLHAVPCVKEAKDKMTGKKVYQSQRWQGSFINVRATTHQHHDACCSSDVDVAQVGEEVQTGGMLIQMRQHKAWRRYLDWNQVLGMQMWPGCYRTEQWLRAVIILSMQEESH